MYEVWYWSPRDNDWASRSDEDCVSLHDAICYARDYPYSYVVGPLGDIVFKHKV